MAPPGQPCSSVAMPTSTRIGLSISSSILAFAVSNTTANPAFTYADDPAGSVQHLHRWIAVRRCRHDP